MKSIRKFLGDKRLLENRGLHTAIIHGTGKIRTSTPAANLYSRESDLEKITAKQYRAAGARKKL